MKPAQVGGQVITELDEFIELSNRIQPTSYLEIGAREGIALDYYVRRVPTITKVVVVDLPGAQWGRAGSDKELVDRLVALRKDRGITWKFHMGNSQHENVVKNVTKNGPFDIIFIDGDHTYTGVLADYTNYSPMATKMVALHDINHPPDSKAYGPTRLWHELDGDKHEFIADGSRKGIGAVVK
jgi:hypothetical protein